MDTRCGTDVDAALASKTFSELGYKIKLVNDQTANDMIRLMRTGNGNFLAGVVI